MVYLMSKADVESDELRYLRNEASRDGYEEEAGVMWDGCPCGDEQCDGACVGPDPDAAYEDAMYAALDTGNGWDDGSPLF